VFESLPGNGGLCQVGWCFVASDLVEHGDLCRSCKDYVVGSNVGPWRCPLMCKETADPAAAPYCGMFDLLREDIMPSQHFGDVGMFPCRVGNDLQRQQMPHGVEQAAGGGGGNNKKVKTRLSAGSRAKIAKAKEALAEKARQEERANTITPFGPLHAAELEAMYHARGMSADQISHVLNQEKAKFSALLSSSPHLGGLSASGLGLSGLGLGLGGGGGGGGGSLQKPLRTLPPLPPPLLPDPPTPYPTAREQAPPPTLALLWGGGLFGLSTDDGSGAASMSALDQLLVGIIAALTLVLCLLTFSKIRRHVRTSCTSEATRMKRNEEGLGRISDVAKAISLGLDATLTSTNQLSKTYETDFWSSPVTLSAQAEIASRSRSSNEEGGGGEAE